MKELPEFRHASFLREHALRMLVTLRPPGNEAAATPDELRPLARRIVVHAWALRRFAGHDDAPAWRAAAVQALRTLQARHDDRSNGGYARADGHHHAADLAAVLLAQAEAHAAGLDGGDGLLATFKLLERYFWEPAHGLYADEADARWQLAAPRRAATNLALCDALLAAHEASGEAPLRDRATRVAESVLQRLGTPVPGLPWQHHGSDWSVEEESGACGVDVGVLVGWSSTLLRLERALPGIGDDNWMQHRARALFGAAVRHGWDRAGGGLVRGLARDLSACDPSKPVEIQARAIGAAASLAARTVEGGYWDWYDRLWAHAWQATAADPPTPADSAVHVLRACFESLDALEREAQLSP